MNRGSWPIVGLVLAGLLPAEAAFPGKTGTPAPTPSSSPRESGTQSGSPRATPAAATYRAASVHGPASLSILRRRYGPQGFEQVLRLNRVDAEHAGSLDTLMLPEPPQGFVAAAPLPARVTELDSVAKAIVVGIRVQAFAAYDSGRLVRWGPVSTGGRGAPTRPGGYHVNWKLPVHRSTVDSAWVMRWCVNVDNVEGTALHQYALPGLPESHCCVRLLEADARWIYQWVDTWTLARTSLRVLRRGTPVHLIGAYDFGAPPPWRRLGSDPGAGDMSGREVTEGLASAARKALEEKP